MGPRSGTSVGSYELVKPELKLCGLLAEREGVDAENARNPRPEPEHCDGGCRREGPGAGAFRRARDSGNRCNRDPREAAIIMSGKRTTCSGSRGARVRVVFGPLQVYDGGRWYGLLAGRRTGAAWVGAREGVRA